MRRNTNNSNFDLKLLEGDGALRDGIASILEKAGLIGTSKSYPQDLYTGETHAMTFDNTLKKKVPSRYTGPNTQISHRMNDKPRDDGGLDASSKKHDIAYYKANQKLKKNQISEDEFQQTIHQADEDFIKEVNLLPNIKMNNIIASKSIQLKKWLEEKSILPISEFSKEGSGITNYHEIGKKMLSEYQSPTHRLKKKMMNKQGGVAAFLLPVLTTLGIEGLTYLVGKLTKKKDGSGIMDEKTLIKKAVSLMDDMKVEKQIELLSTIINKKNIY